MMLLLLSLANATSGFNASAPAASFTGKETYTQDEAVRLWSTIERLEDPDRTLFAQENFNKSTAWPTKASFAPWIDDCFGSTTPGSWAALLHIGPSDAAAHGTPILFVPGAGDNGSRGFITMATHMDRLFRPVFVLTFAHPHGDTFMQAEMVADAIARIKARTGAAQVDVVSHSKGGIATAIYLSNDAGTQWPDKHYMSVGTPYRGDVRRAVFIATPLGGIDTAFRWPNGNYASLDASSALAPTSWSAYGFTSLSDQDFLKDGKDYFPGQRQIISRQEYSLPGEMPWLGAYSLQTDWYTTYEGGYGFSSTSPGIDEVISEGGALIDRLHAVGVDPSVELYLLAGTSPMMPNGSESYLLQTLSDAGTAITGVEDTSWAKEWIDLATSGTDAWGDFLKLITQNSFTGLKFTSTDLQGLADGKLILGEITGESDGLVFTTSATDAAALTARGAIVKETRTAELSHLDLLYASPITGGLLQQSAAADPLENGWMTGVGARYTAEDTIGQVETWLADAADTGDTGDTGTVDDTGDDSGTIDTGTPTDDTGDSDVGGYNEEKDGRDVPCGCTQTSGGSMGWLGVLAALVMGRRNRR